MTLAFTCLIAITKCGISRIFFFLNRKKIIVQIFEIFFFVLILTAWTAFAYNKNFESSKDFRTVIIIKITDSYGLLKKIEENEAANHGNSRDANICVTNHITTNKTRGTEKNSRSGTKIHQECIKNKTEPKKIEICRIKTIIIRRRRKRKKNRAVKEKKKWWPSKNTKMLKQMNVKWSKSFCFIFSSLSSSFLGFCFYFVLVPSFFT